MSLLSQLRFFGAKCHKQLLTLTIALAMGTLGTGLAQANEFVNGNMDAISVGPQNGNTPTGWSVVASKAFSGPYFDGCSSEPWCNVLEQPTGQGLFFKPFQGNAAEDDELSVLFYQDVPGVPAAKYTLSGYAAAEANYSGLFATNSPAPATVFFVEFLDQFGTSLGSNALDLVAAGLPTSGPGSMSQFPNPFTTLQYTAPPNTTTVRAGVAMLNVYNSQANPQSFFVDAMDLAFEAPPGSPEITSQPAHKTVSAGETVTFTVGVTSPTTPTYQWQFYGTNITDGGKFSGTATATLTVSDVSANEVGHYRVRVSNDAGQVQSAEATLAIVGINFYPVVTITGKVGDTYRVDYATQLAPTTWIPLSTNVLTQSPQLIMDSTTPVEPKRFYRAVFTN